MVLEATMVVIDNSEYMRNGDYLTNRYQAQLDTVEVIFRRKTYSNPENTVGIMTNAGESVVVVSNLTSDYGKILSGLHSTTVNGKSQFINSIQVACLALKNRQNKSQRQRVIIFVGSPITESEKDLEKLAKRLKKNNLSVDIINFGEQETNTELLEKFISIVNSNNTSHLVTVPPGSYLLYEQVDRSPVLREEVDTNDDSGDAGDFGTGMDFGMDDPNMDPELAMAIRLSLEEENARQAKADADKEAGSQQDALESVKEEGGDDKMDESK